MIDEAYECPVCFETYESNGETPFDGPDNSDIPSNCHHYLCVLCWSEIFLTGDHRCPLCREDVETWLSRYEEDSDEE